MRVTAATKEATRQRIRESALALFRQQGFESATTRDIARGAGIAVGTLFNYYTSKEVLALEFVSEAMNDAETAARKRLRVGMSLEEELFLRIATDLRRLRPFRDLVRGVFDLAFGSASTGTEDGVVLRARHLETVAAILQKDHPELPTQAVSLQMYWMLYTGVLAFWINDASPKQEDTLALLDQTLKMYAAWLGGLADS
jgi:AcrR family transcriptional regulator